MRLAQPIFILCLALWPTTGRSAPIGYSLTVTTAYASANPFPNRLDQAFTEPDTGYFQVSNTGSSIFSGTVGMVALSVFAGDLSFASAPIVLLSGESVSVAVPDDASDVGGFNGPAYFFRPGVEVTLNGTVSNGAASQGITLLVADADIHSGVWRTGPSGLASDSFVLQGGDPWGFDSGDTFELGQANGSYMFAQAAPEPGSMALLATGLSTLGSLSLIRRTMSRSPLARDRPQGA